LELTNHLQMDTLSEFRDTPRILVIIVTWNKKEFVLNLLKSLDNITYPNQAMDLLVVDNHSKDGTAEAISKFYPRVKLIVNSTNLGGTGGFNTGLKYAFDMPEGVYDYIWLLDNDVVVHSRALIELVKLLDENTDAGVAGSTMMQLDYPWRINEMGSFLNRNNGELILNHHHKEILSWEETPIDKLLDVDIEQISELSKYNSYIDADYVAATSLLVRFDVAKEAGLWMNFFIHYDDVEWCLRVARNGYRIMASTRSVIWHLSAEAKVPTWILYYDNRNLLYLLQKHGTEKETMKQAFNRVLKKGLYYTLIGKTDLGGLHIQAADDFLSCRMGKKNIDISIVYKKIQEIDTIFNNRLIQKILIPWTVDLEKTGMQKTLLQAVKRRPALQIDFLTESDEFQTGSFPHSETITIPDSKIASIVRYLRLRKKYDLVIQSDYEPVIYLSWLKSEILFLNDHTFCRVRAPKPIEIFRFILALVKRWIFKASAVNLKEKGPN